MGEFVSLEPAIDPNNRIGFLIDWELTMKCNLDCSYCRSDIYGGHDNSQPHPPLTDCLKTIDFMFEYADIYMQTKPKGLQYVILNVYGGESLHHPDIVRILQNIKTTYEQHYQDRWHLTVTTTTNAIVSKKKLAEIIPFIDEFTVSYHTGNTNKQKNLFRSNILDISAANKRIKCVIMMHPDADLFEDAQQMIAWCQQYDVKFLPKQLDSDPNGSKFNYQSHQVKWFGRMYAKKTYNLSHSFPAEEIDPNQTVNLSTVGRACCGGRSVCKDQMYKTRVFHVDNRFTDWYCSVNEFFVYIKQVTGEIYTNKDCKMNFDNTVGPIGHLVDAKSWLQNLRYQIKNKSLPVIQCQKTRCLCGLCAPKAKDRDNFDTIMEKYHA